MKKDTKSVKLRTQRLKMIDSIKGFRCVKRKIFIEMTKDKRPRIRKRRKMTSRALLTKALLTIKGKIQRIEMFIKLYGQGLIRNLKKNRN